MSDHTSVVVTCHQSKAIEQNFIHSLWILSLKVIEQFQISAKLAYNKVHFPQGQKRGF